jgi:hypothetical protein
LTALFNHSTPLIGNNCYKKTFHWRKVRIF